MSRSPEELQEQEDAVIEALGEDGLRDMGPMDIVSLLITHADYEELRELCKKLLYDVKHFPYKWAPITSRLEEIAEAVDYDFRNKPIHTLDQKTIEALKKGSS